MYSWNKQITFSSRPSNKLENQIYNIFRKFISSDFDKNLLTSSIQQAYQLLYKAYCNGISALSLVKARAFCVDMILFCLLQNIKVSNLAVIAIGGYGRKELCPFSDIDVMLLVDKPNTEEIESFVNRLYATFPTVTPVVRTIDDSIRIAKTDYRSLTALLEARLVYGRASLLNELKTMLRKELSSDLKAAYLQFVAQDRQARYEHFGKSFAYYEPHVKEGWGGLRDFHLIKWILNIVYSNVRLDYLVRLGLCTLQDIKNLTVGYEFLLTLRTHLHYYCGKKEDRLRRELWSAIAWKMGYKDRSLASRVEKLMRKNYLTSRTVYFFSKLVEEFVLEEQPWIPKRLKMAYTKIGPNLYIVKGKLQCPQTAMLRNNPKRILQLFYTAQQLGVELSAKLKAKIHKISQERHIKDRFASPDVRGLFLELLKHRGNLGKPIRQMDECRILKLLLPQWDKLIQSIKLEFYHLYPVVEHTIKAVEILDCVFNEGEKNWGMYSQIYKQIIRPEIFHLTVLLHDIGRTKKVKDHAVAGVKLAQRCAKMLGLDTQALTQIALLVEKHLTMIKIAQGRDITDPKIVKEFALEIGSEENLNMLTLLTMCDTIATAPSLWTEYRKGLLSQLYLKSIEVLRGKYEIDLHNRLSYLVKKIKEIRKEPDIEKRLISYLATLPSRYIFSRTPQEVILDMKLISEYENELPNKALISWTSISDLNLCELNVVTRDRIGLFRLIAGAIAAAGLTVLEAEAFTTANAIALDKFRVADAYNGLMPTNNQRKQVERLLNCLLGSGPIHEKMKQIEQKVISMARYSRFIKSKISVPVSLRVINSESKDYTVLELQAPDFPGLLFWVSDIFARLCINIVFAKLNTELNVAWDVFYVVDIDGKKIENTDKMAQLIKGVESLVLEKIEQAKSCA